MDTKDEKKVKRKRFESGDMSPHSENIFVFIRVD